MKIGFLDSIYNFADIYTTASAVMMNKVADLQVERLTAPQLLKVPVCCKLLFSKGCDAVVVFLNINEEDIGELDLVHEKIIDLEVAEGKFVFFCILSESEFTDEQSLNDATAKKLDIIMDAVVKVVNAPKTLSSDIQNQSMTDALSFFGTMSGAAQEPHDAGMGDATGPADSTGRSLF